MENIKPIEFQLGFDGIKNLKAYPKIVLYFKHENEALDLNALSNHEINNFEIKGEGINICGEIQCSLIWLVEYEEAPKKIRKREFKYENKVYISPENTDGKLQKKIFKITDKNNNDGNQNLIFNFFKIELFGKGKLGYRLETKIPGNEVFELVPDKSKITFELPLDIHFFKISSNNKKTDPNVQSNIENIPITTDQFYDNIFIGSSIKIKPNIDQFFHRLNDRLLCIEIYESDLKPSKSIENEPQSMDSEDDSNESEDIEEDELTEDNLDDEPIEFTYASFEWSLNGTKDDKFWQVGCQNIQKASENIGSDENLPNVALSNNELEKENNINKGVEFNYLNEIENDKNKRFEFNYRLYIKKRVEVQQESNNSTEEYEVEKVITSRGLFEVNQPLLNSFGIKVDYSNNKILASGIFEYFDSNLEIPLKINLFTQQIAEDEVEVNTPKLIYSMGTIAKYHKDKHIFDAEFSLKDIIEKIKTDFNIIEPPVDQNNSQQIPQDLNDQNLTKYNSMSDFNIFAELSFSETIASPSAGNKAVFANLADYNEEKFTPTNNGVFSPKWLAPAIASSMINLSKKDFTQKLKQYTDIVHKVIFKNGKSNPIITKTLYEIAAGIDEIYKGKEQLNSDVVRAIQRILIFLKYSTTSSGAKKIDGDFGFGTNKGLGSFLIKKDRNLLVDIQGKSLEEKEKNKFSIINYQANKLKLIKLNGPVLHALIEEISGAENNDVITGDINKAIEYIDQLDK